MDRKNYEYGHFMQWVKKVSILVWLRKKGTRPIHAYFSKISLDFLCCWKVQYDVLLNFLSRHWKSLILTCFLLYGPRKRGWDPKNAKIFAIINFWALIFARNFKNMVNIKVIMLCVKILYVALVVFVQKKVIFLWTKIHQRKSDFKWKWQKKLCFVSP